MRSRFPLPTKAWSLPKAGTKSWSISASTNRFWAWHQLWLGDVKVGDPWATVDSRWDIYHAKVSTPDSESRSLRIGLYWKSPLRTDSAGKPVPLVKETTTITVHRAKDDMRKIDFQIELLAMQDDMRLGGSEDAKGYGGFSTRIKLPQGLAFTGTDGPVEPTTLSLEAGPWIDISGKLGESDKISGLAILVHSSNPGDTLTHGYSEEKEAARTPPGPAAIPCRSLVRSRSCCAIA